MIVYAACLAAFIVAGLAGYFYGPTGVGVTILLLLIALTVWFVGWVVKQIQKDAKG